MQSEQNDIISILYRRRSVRDYQDKPVEREKMELLLKAAMAAPNGNNKQVWEFVAVDEAQALHDLQDALDWGKYNCTAAIVVCANLDLAGVAPEDVHKPDLWSIDGAAAIMNILTAAVGLGLGGVWIGGYPNMDAVERISRKLNLPGHIIPTGVALLGYPKDEPEPRTQYVESKVHWQKY